jgi:hypothetical protein
LYTRNTRERARKAKACLPGIGEATGRIRIVEPFTTNYGGFIMKARLLQLAAVLLIGIGLAGCAGTGAGIGSSSQNPQAVQGPWRDSPSDMTN